MEKIYKNDPAIEEGLLKLLEIKDSDIRNSILQQGLDAIDHGVHAGGAFSAVVPMVSLYYGGGMKLNVEQPTEPGQDQFILSKGHAVAALAAVYADKGYFDAELLKGSRSYESILNGHPGPILPGVPISTGPLGQGISAAVGLAIAAKEYPQSDVYCMVGDGEMQEGGVWEALMYGAEARLDNLCVIVDKNGGQLDNVSKMIVCMDDISDKLRAFGYRVIEVDATGYAPVKAAFDAFHENRNGKPTAIVCNATKGSGSFASAINGHKITLNEEVGKQEIIMQLNRRAGRVDAFVSYYNALACDKAKAALREAAEEMNLCLKLDSDGRASAVEPGVPVVKTKPAAPRDKAVRYDEAKLPVVEAGKSYAASDIVKGMMKEFAKDQKIVTVDSDLSSTSGLQEGAILVDKTRALNVGIAESNMMNIGEAFASVGKNVWVSTFCPFFDWRVMRRIAVSYQERLEAMETEGGWLTEGHGLDLTFVATAPDMETQTNGATHMGNDDILFFDQMAHLKIITICCPAQLKAAMKWIAEGNKGLVYLRILRKASAAIYPDDMKFEYGKGYTLRESDDDQAVIVSYGRGVYEALAAADALKEKGISVKVVDMPSVDEEMLLTLYRSGKPVVLAEQNNGYLANKLPKLLLREGEVMDPSRILTVNMLDETGAPQFVHSGTYAQLTKAFGLSGAQLAERIEQKLG